MIAKQSSYERALWGAGLVTGLTVALGFLLPWAYIGSQSGGLSIEMGLFGARVPQLDVDLTPFAKHMQGQGSDSPFYSATMSALVSLCLALVFAFSALLVCAWQSEAMSNWGDLDVKMTLMGASALALAAAPILYVTLTHGTLSDGGGGYMSGLYVTAFGAAATFGLTVSVMLTRKDNFYETL